MSPELPVSLPPPGVSAYCPPMLRDQPPHLSSMTLCSGAAPEASAAFTPSAHGVDSHCEATKPSSGTNLIDASAQVDSLSLAIDPDMEISQENHKKSKKSPKIQKKLQKIQKKFSQILSQHPMVISVTPPYML